MDKILIFCGAMLLACLASLYALLRERSGQAIPRAVVVTTVLGGLLGGFMATAAQIHWYGWDTPWRILALAVPAGFGAPLLIASSVTILTRVVRRILGDDDAS